MGITILIAFIFLLRYELVLNADHAWWQLLAGSVFDLAAFFVLMIISMHYLNLVSFFSKRLLRARLVFFNIFLLIWVTGYNTVAIIGDNLLIGLCVVMITTSYIFGMSICKATVRAFPISERELSWLVSKYPPRHHKDMATFNVIAVCVVLMPIVLKYTLWR